jgi:hypothetical protein
MVWQLLLTQSLPFTGYRPCNSSYSLVRGDTVASVSARCGYSADAVTEATMHALDHTSLDKNAFMRWLTGDWRIDDGQITLSLLAMPGV